FSQGFCADLSNVEDIRAVCELLKHFLRNLKEPLLIFHLSKAFVEGAEISDDNNSVAAMYQSVGELPQANRDTLASLMLHFQRVAQNPDTKMDISNLANVFVLQWFAMQSEILILCHFSKTQGSNLRLWNS
uniref:Rho-GAP domain-containing protein n=1 Tax=Anolis carolinensis TaxID=28377 RepID=A0A803TAI8_ANOCA